MPAWQRRRRNSDDMFLQRRAVGRSSSWPRASICGRAAFWLGMARRRHAVAAEMADEIIVAAAQLGTLRRRHVLKVEVRQIGLTQHGLVRRIRATAGVFLPSSHGASMRKNT